jgi:uroporphyrinogen decarboxylase
MRPDITQFIATLRRQKAGYVPNAELGIHPKIKEQFLGRPVSTLADEVAFWQLAGYDYVKLQPEVDFNPAGMGAGLQAAYSEDGTVLRKWATATSEVIRTPEDLDRYVFPEMGDIGYSRFDRIGTFLPPGLGVVGQYGDIFTMTWEMMGFEGFSMSVFEEPELVEALNSRIGEIVVEMFRRMAAHPVVDALWYSDDIAYAGGLMVSPAVLRRYFFPWLKQVGDIARGAGKPLIYHSDGILYDVMEEIIACGVDALHPIEPKAMVLEEVKNRFGDRLCLIGHVDVDMLARGTVAEVREQVRRNIAVAAHNGGYCAGSGNSIPDYVKFENYMAMLDAVREFGSG